MSGQRTIECRLHVERRAHGGQQTLREGAPLAESPGVAGRLPRVTRLMALAIRFEGLLAGGHVSSYAELARLGHVSRARLTQIMNLTLLAPDLQEKTLFLPRVERGRDPILLRDLQPIALTPDWREQRRRWIELSSKGA